MRCIFVIILISAFPAMPALGQAPRTLDRDLDPVVLTGADIPLLAGSQPGEIVAFRYAGGWEQIPVQIDERAELDYAIVYGESTPSGITTLDYTDADTYAGTDPDATFDDDDEIVFMAKDTGDRVEGIVG